ncbi:hypothetical protein BCR41DRAFT_349856, partial [Lobosporangium transversale]
TISTNGLVLNLLAYDTTQMKRQQQSDELELSQGFLNTPRPKAAGKDLIDEGYANIYWKRSSKLLENVELTFNEPGRCSSTNTTTVVGCDPDIVNTLTFPSLDPHDPNLRRFLYLPVLRFNHLLKKRKREKGMIEVENAIPVFGRDPTSDYAVQRVLKILGEKGVLVIGLGSYESSKGVPSKHTAITRHFVTQAVYSRSKYCRACKVFFDRDAVGAENIARIGLAQIERQERPAKYKPMEESPAPAAERMTLDTSIWVPAHPQKNL